MAGRPVEAGGKAVDAFRRPLGGDSQDGGLAIGRRLRLLQIWHKEQLHRGNQLQRFGRQRRDGLFKKVLQVFFVQLHAGKDIAELIVITDQMRRQLDC